MTVRVLVGDALSVLRTLPSESVQCVVTSPPYFGLRSYSTDPQVWGGDPEHGHIFGVEVVPAEIGRGNWAQGVNGRGEVQPGGVAAKREPIRTVRERGFCPCGAWRGELGAEPTPALFVEHLVSIFDEVWRVLRQDGTCWVNLGDSYSGSGKGPTGHNSIGDQEGRQGTLGLGQDWNVPPKNLMLMPYRFALAMQARGWIVRSQIVWAKTSAMPESVRDRPTSAWEPIWLFSKGQRYYYDAEAVRQPNTEGSMANARYSRQSRNSPAERRDGYGGGNDSVGVSYAAMLNPAGANLRNVWALSPSPTPEAHFATFPPEIPRRAILAGTSERGACPACGAGWVRVVEREKGREIEAPKLSALAQTGVSSNGTGGSTLGIGGRGNGGAWEEHGSKSVTTGWSPGCSCDAGPPVPQVVLDPFGGSGTTGLVADRLGRDAILVELNAEYAEMARKKIASDAGTLFGEAVAVERATTLPLWDAGP